jgi:hypothetical protein
MSTGTAAFADKYLHEVVQLHGVASSIVSDQDPRFTSKFWNEVQRLLGTKLLMSTTFHPEIDGATKRANRVINNILHALIKPDQTDWADKLPMAEFAINSSHNKSTRFAPFEVNYGYLPTLQGLLDTVPDDVKPGICVYTDKAREYLQQAHDSIIASRIFQTHYANQLHWEEPNLKVGDRVWLSTKNLAMPKGWVQKLRPLFIRLFPILQAMPKKLNY